jgi:hypothetical protein
MKSEKCYDGHRPRGQIGMHILLEIRVLQVFFTNITNPTLSGSSRCEKPLKVFRGGGGFVDMGAFIESLLMRV